MKRNPLKKALSEGRIQIGTWVNMIRNPAVLTLLQAAGLDYARVDMEHSSPSIETIANMALLARALEFPIVVRPPDGNREWITRFFSGSNSANFLHVSGACSVSILALNEKGPAIISIISIIIHLPQQQ